MEDVTAGEAVDVRVRLELGQADRAIVVSLAEAGDRVKANRTGLVPELLDVRLCRAQVEVGEVQRMGGNGRFSC